MKIAPIACLLLTLVPAVAVAENTRSLGAHEHGAGVLNVAIEGNAIAMEFEAPGADIVGFEYKPSTDEDRKLIEAAKADLANPLQYFVLGAAAGCSVVEASVELHGDDEHHDHEEEHDHDDHADEAKDGHDDHAHDEHGQDDHDDHAHDDHDDHAEDAKDNHDHADDKAEGAEHSEFHAQYQLTCDDLSAANEITFAYFERFPHARELDVQIVSPAGAQAFEVERDEPVLDLKGLF